MCLLNITVTAYYRFLLFNINSIFFIDIITYILSYTPPYAKLRRLRNVNISRVDRSAAEFSFTPPPLLFPNPDSRGGELTPVSLQNLY